MSKQTGSILLVAGTCIGSGMIALPLVLAQLGIIPSTILLIIICVVSYYISIIGSELSLQIEYGLPLHSLAKIYCGRVSQFISSIGFKILTYSLLAVFIYGGSSILQKLLEYNFAKKEYDLSVIIMCYSLGTFCVLSLPIKFIDYANRTLFLGLLIVITILIIALIGEINWTNLPLFSENLSQLSSWRIAIPVVFTSFGFQIILHTLVNYCDQNTNKLRKAFFYGVIISAIIYLIWNISTLSVIYNNNLTFYQKIISGEVEIGDLIKELSEISKWKSMQLFVWIISSLAILTSLIGVGIGLKDSIRNIIQNNMVSKKISSSGKNFISSGITVLPPCLISILAPNAFISALSFAGMISAFIAIIMPIYLFWKMKSDNKNINLNFSEIRNQWIAIGLFCIGIIIILCEIGNIIH
jgi:tyrosine-specific transport protein